MRTTSPPHIARARRPASSSIAIMDWFHEVFISGVDFDLAGNGGPECVDIISMQQRIAETFAAVVLALSLWMYGYRQLDHFQVPLPPARYPTYHTFTKRLLLVILCLVFGVEMGFKFATKTAIFVLNPCHVITIMQVRSCPYQI